MNHSEGLFIGLTAGVTVMIWVVWILLGFLMKDSRWHDPCVAFGLFVTATWLLLIMFVPKMYYLNAMDRGGGLHRSRTTYDAYNNNSTVYPGSLTEIYPHVGDSSFTEIHPGNAKMDVVNVGLQKDDFVMGHEVKQRGDMWDGNAGKGAVKQNGKVIHVQEIRTIPFEHDPNATYLRPHTGAPNYSMRPLQSSALMTSRKPRDNHHDVTFADSRTISLNSLQTPRTIAQSEKHSESIYHYDRQPKEHRSPSAYIDRQRREQKSPSTYIDRQRREQRSPSAFNQALRQPATQKERRSESAYYRSDRLPIESAFHQGVERRTDNAHIHTNRQPINPVIGSSRLNQYPHAYIPRAWSDQT
jgi:hypothetical protein